MSGTWARDLTGARGGGTGRGGELAGGVPPRRRTLSCPLLIRSAGQGFELRFARAGMAGRVLIGPCLMRN